MLKKMKNIIINCESSYIVILECWYIYIQERKGAKFLPVLVIHGQTSWQNHAIGEKNPIFEKILIKTCYYTNPSNYIIRENVASPFVNNTWH